MPADRSTLPASLPGWVGGLAEWTEGETAFLSIAFTWKIPEAFTRAIWWRALGYQVIAGGPAMFLPRMRRQLADVAKVPTRTILRDGKQVVVPAEIPGHAVHHHNSNATIASRGCPVGCSFCIVPVLEGASFTLLPDFEPRPILCDNNLSALPAEYQDHIIARYRAAGVRLLDANSGFEPETFDDEVYARWRDINRGPWRFAYDEQKERAAVERVTRMLRAVTPRRKRVYVLIGNEPMASCLDRINEVIAWGCEPHVQPLMKLSALEKRYHIQKDWNEQSLRDMARWANHWPWHKQPFEAYRRSFKTVHADRYDATTGLFA